MRSPALAIGWEFRRRHRWGLIAVAGYLFAVAAIRFLILEPGEPVLVDSVRFAAVVSVPLTTTFVYLLRSEEHTSELQSLAYLVCRLLLEKKKKIERAHKYIVIYWIHNDYLTWSDNEE